MTESKFKHISVGRDGSIWAAGKADGTIFRLYGDAGILGWVQDKAGKAEVIAAVDWGNAWCVNHKHEIWHLKDAESLDKGGTWTQVPTHSGRADAQTISVGGDGSVWYTQTNGTIFRSAAPGNGKRKPSWVQDKVGKATVIAAVDSKTAWVVNKDHEIWFLQGGKWTQIPTHSGRADAKTISIGSDESLWYGSIGGAIYRHVQPGDGVSLPRWMQDTDWSLKRMGHADVISVNTDKDIWGLNNNGQVWQSYDRKWKQVVGHGPAGEQVWKYQIKSGDGLMAIVRKKFGLKDPKDTREINRLVDLIVAQNHGMTRDHIKAGDRFTLRY